MARGYPDFFGYSVFPWQGDVTQSEIALFINSGMTDTIIILAGKRVIYNAYFRVSGGVTHLTDNCSLQIDGLEVASSTWETGTYRLPAVSIPTEPFIVEVNEEVFRYSGYFNGIFTVGVSVALVYTNNSVENRNITGGFAYSLIQ